MILFLYRAKYFINRYIFIFIFFIVLLAIYYDCIGI